MAPRRPPSSDSRLRAFDGELIDVSELHRVEVSRGRPKSSLCVRFDSKDLERLQARAEYKGVGVTQLVRRWVLERIDEPEEDEEMDNLLGALDRGLKAAKALQRTRKRRAG